MSSKASPTSAKSRSLDDSRCIVTSIAADFAGPPLVGGLGCFRNPPRLPPRRARAGATQKAQDILDGLYNEGLGRLVEDDPQELISREETRSGLARTYKDIGLEAWPVEPAVAARHWEVSLQLYWAAYGLRMNY